MAMNKQRRTSNISNIFSYDDAGNIVIKDYSQVIRYNWNGTLHAFVGGASISSIAAATTDTDKFLVSDGGVLKYRTGAQLLSDIGAQSFDGNGFVKMSGTSVTYDNSTYLTTANATTLYVPYSGATTDVDLNTKNLLIGQGSVGAYILMVGNKGTNYVQIENSGSRARYQMDSFVFTSKQYGGTKTVYFNTTASTGTDYTISFPDKNGTVAMTSDIVAGITGTGTANYIPKWTGASGLGNSVIYETGTNIIIGSTTDEGYKFQVNGGSVYTKSGGIVSDLNSSISQAIYATGQLLTSAASNGMIYLDTTWNTTGNPSAIYLNVTNTTSGAFSKLLDLRVGLTAMFQVDKTGGILTGQPTGGTQGVWKLGQYNATAPSATGYVEVEINGVLYKLLAST
jgi:hypothetical protein